MRGGGSCGVGAARRSHRAVVVSPLAASRDDIAHDIAHDVEASSDVEALATRRLLLAGALVASPAAALMGNLPAFADEEAVVDAVDAAEVAPAPPPPPPPPPKPDVAFSEVEQKVLAYQFKYPTNTVGWCKLTSNVSLTPC